MAGTGGDGLPFIGSLMRLVSIQDMAYEGVLYTIDMPNSTIALSNVRCFGTEGRRNENEVPPSDQVFEYVVFKGSEIKELTVVQPPPAQPPAPQPPVGFSDPAIVSAGPPPPPAPGSPWGAPPAPSQPYGASQPFGSSPWGPPPPAGPPPPPGLPPPPAPPPAPAPPPGQPAPAPAPTVAITPLSTHANGHSSAAPSQQRRGPPASYAHAAGGRAPLMHPPRGRGGGRGGPPTYQDRPVGRGQHQQHQRQQQPRPPPVEVPKEEFNFEEALKRFNKQELGQQAAEEVPEAAKQSTYSKDDFFDSLSCDTLQRMTINDGSGEREDWRAKVAAQRKVDQETFGGMARAGGYRGRGRGRGRGYYGGRGRGRRDGQPQQAAS